MKKILHLLNTSSFSGAENVACTIIKNLRSEYEMAYCSPNGPILDKLKEENINYYPIDRLSFSEVKKVLNLYKPDIIHAHDNRATVIASLFANDYKVISHIHGNNVIMNHKNMKTILFNYCSKRINTFIWVSDSSLNDYYYKKNLEDKSIVLYNTVDFNEINLKANEYIPEKKFDIIFLGRLAYPKNPERLIEIIKIAKSIKNDISVAIVGDGVDREKVENIVKNEDLQTNISFLGYQKNPFPILKNSKVLVLTSIYEGTPMCALEAQALGKPIISTPVDGLKKLIVNDYNGFMTNDNEIFAKKIIEFIDNDYSENVIAHFKANNSIEKYISTLQKYY